MFSPEFLHYPGSHDLPRDFMALFTDSTDIAKMSVKCQDSTLYINPHHDDDCIKTEVNPATPVNGEKPRSKLAHTHMDDQAQRLEEKLFCSCLLRGTAQFSNVLDEITSPPPYVGVSLRYANCEMWQRESIMGDREGEREMERRKRQAQLERQNQAAQIETAGQNFGPIFDKPVRVAHVDDITYRVFNTLGEFSNVRGNLMNSSTQRHLLGIPKQPMTPNVDNKSQQRLFPPTLGSNDKECQNTLIKEKATQQIDGSLRRTPGHSNSLKSEHLKSHGGIDKSANSNFVGHRTEGNKSQNSGSSKQGSERQNAKTSDKHKVHGGVSKSGNRGQSKSRTTKSSAADAKSSESHSGPPNGAISSKSRKEFGPRDPQQHRHESKKNDSMRIGHEADSRSEADVLSKKPDSSEMFDACGVKMPARSMFDIEDDDIEKTARKEKSRPKLDIPAATGPNCSSNQDVQSILNIMTDMKSPVTAIQTPIKSDASSKFPFSLEKVKSGLTPIQEVKAIAPLDSANKSKGQPLSDLEDNDQVPCEDSRRSDNEDVNPNKKDQEESMTTTSATTAGNASEGEPKGEVTSGNTINMDNSRVSDSSSESSSSESEGSGSDSESESEEGSAPESEKDEPVKNYGLLNVIEKIKTQKSPATLTLTKAEFVSNNSAPGNSPVCLTSRTQSNGESFPSKPANKLGARHGETSGGFGPLEVNDLMNLSTSKYSGNFDKYSDANDNDIADFNKLCKESKIERTSKAKGKLPTKKAPLKNNTIKSTSAKGVSPQVKGETKKDKSSKTKNSRQSSKSSSSNGQVEVKPKNSAKSTPKSDKKSLPKSKMPVERRGKKKLPSPKSREFVSDSSDEDVYRSPAKSPCKVNGTSMADLVHSPSPKVSACKSSVLSNKGKIKTKPERNPAFSASSLDDVFSNISPCGDEPLLSPLKSPDLMSDIVYKSGIPSLVVKFCLNDIENLPSKDDGRIQSRTSTPRITREVADGLDERPPQLVKSKRKPEDMDQENLISRGESNKKPKNESIAKSPRLLTASLSIPIKEEPQHNESVIPESDRVLDRRRTNERRGSVTSISSHQSNHSSSSSSRKSDKDHPPSKRQKREHDSASETSVVTHTKQSVDWPVEERTEQNIRDTSTEVVNDNGCHRNGHKVSGDECADFDGAFQPHVKRFLSDNRIGQRIDFAEERQLTADDYLNDGKKLKRQADAQGDKNVKALTYFDAVLSFILCGHTMENDPHIPGEKAVTMYNETCEIIKFILKFRGTHQDATYTDKKLAVLCHRCQALLYTRMYKLKKGTSMKMSRALGEYFKTQNKSQQGAQLAPSPWNSTKYTGTPSPMSPTPSPAGSVGSVGSMGSQGSNNCDLNSSQNLSQNKLTNGVGPMSSPATITLPQRIMDMMSKYLVFSNYSLFGLDFWEQSEAMAQEHPEFFHELDQVCGPLTLHSSTLDLVRYARNGLHRLKKS